MLNIKQEAKLSKKHEIVIFFLSALYWGMWICLYVFARVLNELAFSQFMELKFILFQILLCFCFAGFFMIQCIQNAQQDKPYLNNIMMIPMCFYLIFPKILNFDNIVLNIIQLFLYAGFNYILLIVVQSHIELYVKILLSKKHPIIY